MATYLLLRNNKQHGPLSLQHLIQLGLKPYDLVWVDGKSAAWRYPSEIPELKPYAKAVEEQPFDRFYKKPGENKETPPVEFPEQHKQQAVVKHMIPEKHASMPDIIFPDENPGYGNEIRRSAETIQTYQQKASTVPEIKYPDEKPINDPAITGLDKRHEKYYPKKTVYVTMPLQHEMPAPKQEPVFNFQSSPAPDTREEPLTLKTKYEQPLDELKEQYASKLLERKRQSSRNKVVAESLKKAAVIIAIISVGVLIGFAIKPGSNGDGGHETALNNPIQTEAALTLPAANTNENTISSEPQSRLVQPQIEKQQKITKQETVYQQPEESRPVVVKQESPAQSATETKKAVLTRQQNTSQNKEPDFSEPAPPVDANPSTGERAKKTRQNSTGTTSDPATTYEKPESNNGSQINIGSYVNVSSNDYHVVALGGIRNLQLTVSNDSKYVLDNVTVEVQYLKANKELFKTETVHFKAVAPNGTTTIRMPDTNRGMKVNYKIIKVESKEFKNDVAGL